MSSSGFLPPAGVIVWLPSSCRCRHLASFLVPMSSYGLLPRADFVVRVPSSCWCLRLTFWCRCCRLASFLVPMSLFGHFPRAVVVGWSLHSFALVSLVQVQAVVSLYLACMLACMYNRKYLSTIVLRPGVLIPWVLLPWVSYYTYYSGTGICADGLVHLEFVSSPSPHPPLLSFILITLITSFVTTKTY